MIKRDRPCEVKVLAISVLLLCIAIASVGAEGQNSSKAAPDIRGTWSGTFFSKHGNVAGFSMTVVIAPDSEGRLVGSSSLSSNCLKDVKLQVTVNGSQVVLAGSDDSGNNITVRGTLDSTGTNLQARYIQNGSASGKCETDNGTGNLAKRN